MTWRQASRWVLWLFAAAAAIALVAWWWSEYMWPNRVRLADGREGTVRAVTYGTNHVVVEGPLWARLIRRQISTALALKFGVRVHQHTSPNPMAVVWTRWTCPGTNGPPRFASLRNEQGIESETIGPSRLVSQPGSRETLITWQWENFPRGQAKNLVRLYDRDAAYRPSLAGELRVRIPAKRIRNRMPPAAAPPVRVTEGEVEFSLLSLRCEAPEEQTAQPSTAVGRRTTAIFGVVEKGWPSTAWTVSRLEGIGDAGNHFRWNEFNARRSFNRVTVVVPEVLWPEEPGWRILAEFARLQDYQPDQLVTVRGVGALRTNQPFITNMQVEANGIVVQCLDLRGAGQVRRYERGAYRPNADLVVTYTAKVDRARLDLAQVKDNQGRSLRFGHEMHPWKGKYTVALELPADSRTVDLTFASHRTRVIEFRVKPVWTNTVEGASR